MRDKISNGRRHRPDSTADPNIVVAIPVRNEADRILACLAAFSHQEHQPHEVVLLLNNCTDTTASIARSLSPSLPFDLHLVSHTFPSHQANAGHARRMAMALAAERAGPDGILLTTDADTVVPPDWIRRNRAALLQGADLVCGRAVVDPIEARAIPAHLHADDTRERHLIALLDDMAWIIDPDPHDPLPRHTEASGASLAVWVTAFNRVGGVPAVTTGEDRALVTALRQIDARIRHDPAIAVVVSGRVIGRAKGGMAETIRRRMDRQDEFADVQVEPARDALRRLILRRRTRAAWSIGSPDQALAVDLALDPTLLSLALAKPFFGAAWAEIEASSPILMRRPVRFLDLPAEIATAAKLRTRVRMSEGLATDGWLSMNVDAARGSRIPGQRRLATHTTSVCGLPLAQREHSPPPPLLTSSKGLAMMSQAVWQFHCPACSFGHAEHGHLLSAQEIDCFVCLEEDGRHVRLHRWAVADQIELVD